MHVVAALAGERMVFSLDLRGGVPLTGGEDAWAVASEAVARGARRVLVLDLARVGEGGGVGTEALCARLTATHPGSPQRAMAVEDVETPIEPHVLKRAWRKMPGFVRAVINRDRLKRVWSAFPQPVRALCRPILACIRSVVKPAH